MVFGCRKTQISKILKNKESILAEYQSNASGDRVYSNSKARKSKYSDVNDTLYEWFKLATSKNIPVGGPQLIQWDGWKNGRKGFPLSILRYEVNQVMSRG